MMSDFLRIRLAARKREIELAMRTRYQSHQHPTAEQRADLAEVERLRAVVFTEEAEK